MSASSRPLCGRAWGEFSTLTATAGRAISTPLGISVPVSGHTGSGSGDGAGTVTGSSGSLLQDAPRMSAVANPSTMAPALTFRKGERAFHFTFVARKKLDPDRTGGEDERVATLRLKRDCISDVFTIPATFDHSPIAEEEGAS